MSQPTDVEAPAGRVGIVVRAGKTLFLEADGLADAAASRPVTASTRYQISSVSKQWLATVFGLLSERGLVDWDDQIRRWFPTLPYGAEVTIHQLLTHTSGLGHWEAVGGVEEFARTADQERMALLTRTSLRSRPGSTWFYSGPGYALLGRLAALITEEPYPAIIEREIVARLDLTGTTCGRPTEARADVALGDRGGDANPLLAFATLPGTGDIWSTVHDLAVYALAFHDGAIVQPATVRTLLQSAVGLGDAAYTMDWVSASRYAYGRYLGTLAGREAWFHSGDNPGFQSFLGHLPASQTTVAVLSNADDVPISQLVRQTLCQAGEIA